MNDELQEEKVRNQERFEQMGWQRQQDKRDYDELLDEYKRLLGDQGKLINDYKEALDAVSVWPLGSSNG